MKKFMKSAVALLLACLLLIPGGFVFAAEPIDFIDVNEDDWFAPYVDYCSKNGLVQGMTATTFQPDTALSRAMFVTILYRFAEAEATEGAQMPFTDIPELYWGREAILWAYENEIVNGMTPTAFLPDAKITREQMCTILCRFADAMGYEMPGTEEVTAFEDDAMISEYAYDAVYSCNNAGIVNGITIDTFGPKQNATRAQACTILQRFIRYATSTYTQNVDENGKLSYEYADKYGVYESGYNITDEYGNILEEYCEEGDSWAKSVYTYSDGNIVKAEHTDSDGYSATETYVYENGMKVEYKCSDSDGYELTYTYAYDDAGNLIEEKYVDSSGYEKLESYVYDEYGNLVEYKYTDNTGFEQTETYTYKDGVLLEYKCTDSDGYEVNETYSYDEDGNLLEHKYSDTYGYELTETYTYVEGRPLSYVSSDSEGAFLKADYTYDENGGLKSVAVTGDEGFSANAEVGSVSADGRIEECTIVLNGESGVSFVQKFEDGVMISAHMSQKTEYGDNDLFIEYDEMGELTSVTAGEADIEATVESSSFTGLMGMPAEMIVKSGEVTYKVSIDYENNTVKIDDGSTIEIYGKNTEESLAVMMGAYLLQMVGMEYQELTPNNILDMMIG